MINPFPIRRLLALTTLLSSVGLLQAAEVVIIQEDFEGGVVEELNFAQNNNVFLEITDDPAGGDRGKVGVIDLSGGTQWGALWAAPEQIVPLTPLGIAPGADSYVMTADFYLPEDTTMADPDTIGVIARWIDETDNNNNKTEVGNNKAVSTHPVGEWFSMEVSGPIPGSLPDGVVTHLRPIISFRDQADDAGEAAIYVDNISVTAMTSGEDPSLNISRSSPFSTYTDLSPRTGTLNISNSGLNQTLTITEAKLDGDDAEHFEVLNEIPISLPPGETGAIEVRFTPGKGAGAYNASLAVTSNDSSDPTLTIPLTALVVASNAGSELIINGDFEAGSTAGFSSGQSFKTITDPVRTGEFAAVYELAGGLEWGSVNLDVPPPLSPEAGPTRHLRITEEMWEKEWTFSAWYSKPEENAIADDDQAQFIIRWNGVTPDAGPFTNVMGGSLTPGEWTEYTETGVVPEEWPPDSGNPVTEAFLIFSFRDWDANAVGGEQIYMDDWSFNIDGIELSPLPGDLIITDVDLNTTDRSVTMTWTSQAGEFFAVSTSTDLQMWTVLEASYAASSEGESTSYTDTNLGDDLVRYYRVERITAPGFLDTSFEDGMEDWTVGLDPEFGSETATTWEFGPPTVGPGAARTGAGVAGTDLDADYADGAAIVLRSPLIDTQGATRVSLSFWHYLDALSDGEGGQVNLLNAEGERIGALFDTFFGGEDNNLLEWTEATVRLPDLDEPFMIEFQFLSVGGEEPNNGAGWFIDDVRVGK